MNGAILEYMGVTHCATKSCGLTEGIAQSILTSALDGGEWLASRPGPLHPKKHPPVTHWLRGWVGPAVGADSVEKNLRLREIETRPSVAIPPDPCHRNSN
jgi:hypothetical protein